ncbi:hypothetical protein HPB50_011804 [Hyalomma asiaticum]|uniref:Uncharacterized protein n=1 Tax=Hyalomma asiaticum TaxID=266040 RepID=A0ACB7S669_HYAAI|nr:hypothetical protein HPB50_011804 [Hyalomma asiaticum]
MREMERKEFENTDSNEEAATETTCDRETRCQEGYTRERIGTHSSGGRLRPALGRRVRRVAGSPSAACLSAWRGGEPVSERAATTLASPAGCSPVAAVARSSIERRPWRQSVLHLSEQPTVTEKNHAGCRHCDAAAAAHCGIREREYASFNIIGGAPALPGEFPWQVSVRKLSTRGTRHHCGGAAAYRPMGAHRCPLRRRGRTASPSEFLVRVGEYDQRRPEGSEVQVRVTHVIPHPAYGRLQRDLALLRLAKRLRKSSHVRPACLAPASLRPLSNLSCAVSGWGNERTQGTTAYSLNKLRVPLRPLKNASPSTMCPLASGICAAEGPEEECATSPTRTQGDSGGPLSCQLSDGRWYVLGVASFGSGCARAHYPDVYTRVHHFTGWIRDTIAAYTRPMRRG